MEGEHTAAALGSTWPCCWNFCFKGFYVFFVISCHLIIIVSSSLSYYHYHLMLPSDRYHHHPQLDLVVSKVFIIFTLLYFYIYYINIFYYLMLSSYHFHLISDLIIWSLSSAWLCCQNFSFKGFVIINISPDWNQFLQLDLELQTFVSKVIIITLKFSSYLFWLPGHFWNR